VNRKRDMSFSNAQVDISNIPLIEDIDFQGLDKRYLTAELIATLIFWAIIGIGASALLFFNPGEFSTLIISLIIGALVLLIITSFIMLILGFKKKLYAVRERDIVYQSGLLWRKFTVLPYKRIQHAEVQQGPIDRLFELSKLNIFTAGGSSSDMSISGLEINQAQSLKHFILNQTTKDEEE